MAAPAPRPVLVLGGTAEAMALARMLTGSPAFHVITSLAGRTRVPTRPPGDVRIGGFSGADGLVRYLAAEDIAAVIDATHPFATRISANAREACRRTGVPLLTILRPAWQIRDGDTWIEVGDEAEAASRVPERARVLLAVGSQHLLPFAVCRNTSFLVRMIDEPKSALPLAGCTVIIGRPSRSQAAEQALLEANGITHLVCRNSGGEAGYAKIAAARSLGLPVIIIRRPKPIGGATVATAAEARSWLERCLG